LENRRRWHDVRTIRRSRRSRTWHRSSIKRLTRSLIDGQVDRTTLPPVDGPIYQIIEEWDIPQAQIEGLHDAYGSPLESGIFGVLTGLFLIPFAALGGWVFWRVGVRPAKAP
jgi:hypothetical protein